MIVVDDAIWEYRNDLYCHMTSDQPGQAGLDELHKFAATIGMKRSWFQDKPGHPHYDLGRNMRRWAIRKGATPIDSRAYAILVRRVNPIKAMTNDNQQTN